MSKHTTITTILVLLLSGLAVLAPPASAHHDGDALDDSMEQQVCAAVLILTLTGHCQGGDLVLAATPDPEDLPIPEDPTDPGELPAPEDLIPEDLIPEDVPIPEGLPDPNELVPEDAAGDALATPMSTVVGPLCEASDNEPGEICILQFFTLGQALCFLRAQAPGAGAVLVCAAGDILVHCSGSEALTILSDYWADIDCDGHDNEYELQQGCNVADPQSYPIGPGECAGGTGGTTLNVGCGETEPDPLLGNVLFDTDCDGQSTDYELANGCDPTDPAEHPDSPGGCSFGSLPALPEVPGDLPIP